jgi:penicillin-binding protein 1B
LWTDVMQQLPTQGLNLEPPVGVSFDWLDSATGKLSAEGCAGAVWLPVRDDFRPLQSVDCKLTQSPIKGFWKKLLH